MKNSIPKYLFHYTNYFAAKSILNSGTFRLIDIRQQKDKYEIFYAGNIAYEVLKSKFISYYNEDEVISKGLLLAITAICGLFSNSSECIEFKNIFNINKIKNFEELIKIFEEDPPNIFIGSLCKDSNNQILWDKYADSKRGVIIGIDTNILNIKNNININKVHYYDKKSINIGLNNFLNNKLKKKYTDYLNLTNDLIYHISSFVMSSKNPYYYFEKEYRFIDDVHIYKDNFDKIIKSDGQKNYINLPITERDFFNSIKYILFGEMIESRDRREIENILIKNNIVCTMY